jgi:mannosyl-3-phosphoglycerate phosphatase
VDFSSSAVVFTDLDGTFLDHDTYSYDAARPALDELRRRRIPLIFVTSKTRAEVSRLRAEIGLAGDDITENGAASRSYSWLCEQLTDAGRVTGVAVRGFHRMSAEEIAAAAGLPLDVARLAARREHAEPFQILDADRAADLLAELERRGLRWTRGGRFHHVFERGGKGEAVREMLRRFPRAVSIGLGDAPNDLGMLEAVDRPAIVRSAHVETLRQALPGASVTRLPGPAGWNEALLSFFSTREESPNRR